MAIGDGSVDRPVMLPLAAWCGLAACASGLPALRERRVWVVSVRVQVIVCAMYAAFVFTFEVRREGRARCVRGL